VQAGGRLVESYGAVFGAVVGERVIGAANLWSRWAAGGASRCMVRF